MLRLKALHHIAIICSDYMASKKFYTEILGFLIAQETFRKERNSYKLDLLLGNKYVIELFSFPDSPPRASYPEACGLRHLAFEVENIDQAVECLRQQLVMAEPVRVDPITGKRYTFFFDPDQLPIELYEG